ncbi:MAG: ABC transporter permease [Planctomycetota bacterium]|nr:ABC transporter permease [Planctomycetota bacterium]
MSDTLMDDAKTNVTRVESALPKPPRADRGTTIRPRSGWAFVNVGELWRYRELLFFLTWRDVKIRYKQSLLGIAWAVIQPTLYMVVFTIVFGKMAKVPTDGIPYPLFSFSALILWNFYAVGIAQAGNSLLMSSPLVTKVYVPRLTIPFASVGSALFDFFVSFSVLLMVMVFYVNFSTIDTSGVHVGPIMFMVLPILFLTILLALGVGTMLAALNVAYRDFKHTIPFLVQLWMFSTPAIYMSINEPAADASPPAAVQQDESVAKAAAQSQDKTADNQVNATTDSNEELGIWGYVKKALQLNPMNGLIASFRAALLGHALPWRELGYSTLMVILGFIFGCMYFYRLEPKFADII